MFVERHPAYWEMFFSMLVFAERFTVSHHIDDLRPVRARFANPSVWFGEELVSIAAESRCALRSWCRCRPCAT